MFQTDNVQKTKALLKFDFKGLIEFLREKKIRYNEEDLFESCIDALEGLEDDVLWSRSERTPNILALKTDPKLGTSIYFLHYILIEGDH